MTTSKQRMGKASRTKGNVFERAVATFMGWTKTSRGGYEGADLAGSGFSVECKNTKSGAGIAARYLAQAEAQADYGETPIAVMKTRNKGIGDAVVAMRLSTLKSIMSSNGASNNSAGILAIPVPEGLLIVNDITEPHGTVVIEHTTQGFIARQKEMSEI